MASKDVAKNIKVLREHHGLSQEKFGEIVGVEGASVSLWERGKAFPRVASLEKAAENFDIPETWFFEENGMQKLNPDQRIKLVSAPGTTIPVYGKIAAGEAIEMIEIVDEVQIFQRTADLYEKPFALIISGDSMNKVVLDGSVAIIAPIEDPSSEIQNGDIVAVNVNGFDATLKVFTRIPGGIVLSPNSTNPKHEPRIIMETDPDAPNVRILGKMVDALYRVNL